MRQQNQRTALTTVIDIKDKDGRIVGKREIPTYAGLLAKAHDEGLSSINVSVLQFPTKDNGQVAIVQAVVKTQKGTFGDIGDASPSNVKARVAPHFIRMASTRAKARALRDAVDIGTVALEELDELIDDSAPAQAESTGEPARPANDNGHAQGATPETPGAAGSAPPPRGPRGEFIAMSDAQRRMLFRLAAERGVAPENAAVWLLAELGVPDLRAVSKKQASQAIDRFQAERKPPAKSNGTGNGVAAS